MNEFLTNFKLNQMIIKSKCAKFQFSMPLFMIQREFSKTRRQVQEKSNGMKSSQEKKKVAAKEKKEEELCSPQSLWLADLVVEYSALGFHDNIFYPSTLFLNNNCLAITLVSSQPPIIIQSVRHIYVNGICLLTS